MGIITPAAYLEWRKQRWRARTDLEWLCREVLGYRDVEAQFHPFLLKLQRFQKPSLAQFEENDVIRNGRWIYTPVVPLYELPSKKRRVLILDPRGHLKCHRAGQKVIGVADGTYSAPEDLKVGDILRGLNDDYSIAHPIVEAVESQGKQPCYRVRMRSGRVLDVSHNHPFRVMEGWINAEDLRRGDRVPVVGIVPEPKGAVYLPYAELLGWMLGDGSFGNSRITNADPKLRARIVAAAKRAGFCAREAIYKQHCGDVNVLGAWDLWRRLGMYEGPGKYRRSADKFIPEEVFRANNRSIAELLYGLFMSDGTCGKDGIFLLTKSERMAHGVRRLLLRFDIFSNVLPHRTRYNGEQRTYWRVGIQSSPQVRRFFDTIGWDKNHRFNFGAKSNPNHNTVPKEWRKMFGRSLWQRGCKPKGLPINKSFVKYDASKERLRIFAEALQDRRLLNLCKDDLYWDFVEKVEYIGEHETVAVQTSNGTLCLDDVVTHNSTINVAAHTIQWILNYPDIALLVVQATSKKAEDFIFEVKQHFQVNSRFRELFPDHVPQKKVMDWGTRDEFMTEARGRETVRKEKTVMTASIDKGTAGYHFDVMKFSDIVEENNSKTVDQNRAIIRSFAMMENLLVRLDGWIDVEGTRYHEQDLYGTIIEEEVKREERDRQWEIHVRGCFKKRRPDGQPQKFTPEELEYTYELDETKPAPVSSRDPDLRKIAVWPKRFSTEVLEARRLDPLRAENFPCQQLNHPAEYLDSPFPWDEKENYPRFIPLKYFQQHVRIAYYETSVDAAETAGPRSNHWAIVTAGWGEDGTPYIVDIRHERMTPDQGIAAVFDVNQKWHPHRVKIEDVSFNRGLMTGFRREMDRRQGQADIWKWQINFELLKRDNHTTKQERILKTLQPWYKQKDIVFVDLCVERVKGAEKRCGKCAFCVNIAWLKREMTGFGVSEHDDLLDALADLFQEKDWFGRERPRPDTHGEFSMYSKRTQAMLNAWERLTGQEPMDKIYAEPGGGGAVISPWDSYYINRTGGL